jgi:phage tail-like protein
VRGAVPGLPSPHPLARALPAMYQEDEFTREFVAAFDEVLAPVLSTLDNFEHYLDPTLAPLDFVDWLAGWLGVVPDEGWPAERRRELVARAVTLYRRRGTVRGLAEQLALATGGKVEVRDSGGVSWSGTPSAPMPGSGDAAVRVVVTVADPSKLDQRRLERLVAAAKPAHVAHHVEVAGP